MRGFKASSGILCATCTDSWTAYDFSRSSSNICTIMECIVCRLEDVRAAEIDKVQIASCFRPGDIVKAEVVSLGTSRDYYLSTAQNHLGVVYAKSLAGNAY